jgi:hypothetical protein
VSSGISQFLGRNSTKFNNLDLLVFSVIFILLILNKAKLGINKQIKYFIFSVFLYLIIYFLLGCIKSNPENIIFFLKRLLVDLSIFILSIYLIYVTGVKGFLKILSLLGCLITIFGIYDWFVNKNLFGDYFYRSTGLYGNANLQGEILAFILICMLYSLLNKILGKKYWVLFTIITIALLLTQSRGSMLTLLIISFIMILTKNNINIFKKVLIMSFFITIVSTALFFILDKNSVYSQRILEGNNGDISNDRISALITGIKEIYNNPLFGKGIGNTANNVLNLSAHNFYVNSIEEVGVLFIPFLALFIIFLIYNFVKLFLKKDTSIVGYISLFLMINGFFTHNLLLNYYFYLALPLFLYNQYSLSKQGVINS